MFILIVKFIYKILSKIKMPLTIRRKINDVYHYIIYKYLTPYFIKAQSKIKENHITNYNNSGIIWIFWWQGLNDMPNIVKVCIDSVIKHANNHKVILLTQKNIYRYAHIPKYIYKKLYNNEITLTHFSDILRFNLLNNYGGLWIDSTVFCSSNISDNYFTKMYTSGGYNNNKSHQFISSKWTGFLIGGIRCNPLFQFMNNFFNIYWSYNDRLIDYFLIDYALKYAYIKNIGNFKYYTDRVACHNNPHLYCLVNLLNKPFNIKDYKLITFDTNLFKLTYKSKFDDSNGTFYNKLINKSL